MRALAAVYYSKPVGARGAEDGERGGGDTGVPGAPNPASLSTFSHCADRRHTLAWGLEKPRFLRFPVEFNNLLKPFPLLHKTVN